MAKSITEVEYVSISEAACELIWLNNLLINADLLAEQAAELYAPPDVSIDNKGAIDLANGELIKRRSKYIEVRYHLLRDLIKKSEIKLIHIESMKNVADGLIKPLAKGKFNEFRKMIGVGKVDQIFTQLGKRC